MGCGTLDSTIIAVLHPTPIMTEQDYKDADLNSVRRDQPTGWGGGSIQIPGVGQVCIPVGSVPSHGSRGGSDAKGLAREGSHSSCLHTKPLQGSLHGSPCEWLSM